MCSLSCLLNFEPCDTEMSRIMRQRFLCTRSENAYITLPNFPLARTGDMIYHLAVRELGNTVLLCAQDKNEMFW